MSLPLTVFEWWETGTTQPSIPVNDNALRTMIGMRSAVSHVVTAQPSLSTPDDDGLWYIIPAGATGSDWSTFSENSCAIFFGGNWYEFTPSEGDIVSFNNSVYEFSASAGWVSITGSSGGAVEIVTISGTSATLSPLTHEGVHRYIRCTNASTTSLTFNTSQSYSAGDTFNIRAVGVGGAQLLTTGVTLNEPFGGSLDIPPGGTVTVIMVSGTEGDVMGVTEPGS